MKSLSALAVLALVATGACGPKKVETKPEPQQPTAPPSNPPSTSSNSGATTTSIGPARTGITESEIMRLRNTLAEPLYFQYDSDHIGTEGAASLERKHAVLSTNMSIRIRIEGNADDRGSDEYNLALGQRRAEMARTWLVKRGIDASRITTVSYGEERPVERGASEVSYSKNRRDNFSITAGEFTVGQDR